MGRLWTRSWVFVGLGLVIACEAQSPVPGRRETAAVVAVPKVTTPSCQDYSKLDLEALPPLPKTPYTATFEAVWRIVLEKHFDPTLACQDWPKLRLEYGTKLADVDDASAAYELMNELLGRLGQSHFRVIPQSSGVDADAPRGSARVPIAARLIDDQIVVVDAAVGGIDSTIASGSVLVRVGERELAEVVERAREKAERPSELAFEISRAVENLLSGSEGDRIPLVYKDPTKDDAETRREVTCVTPAGELVSLGNLRDLPTTVEGRMIDGTKIGYLAFNYWMLPLVKEVEALLTGLRADGMESLIIDLRGNPGGVGAMSVPLARMLLTEGGSLGTLQFRDFKQEFQVAANPAAFGGALVLLVDEGTASTSEIFALGMRDLGRLRAIVGGRASAGAALPSLIERLDGGAMLQYVVGDYHSSKGSAAEGDGVVPDVLVDEKRTHFIAGEDPVLDAALALLASSP